MEVQSHSKNMKSMGNPSIKIRTLEEKWAAKQLEWERERRKFSDENKQLKERLEVLRSMNVNL